MLVRIRAMTNFTVLIAVHPFILVAILFLGISPKSFASEPSSTLIQGSVNDPSGHRGRIHITAFLYLTPGGYPAFATECETLSDSEGNYACPPVVPGRYVLLAYSSKSTRPSAYPDDTPSPTFYPGTRNIGDAELVEVRPYTTNFFNFSLQLSPVFRISGRLEGEPKSAALELYSVDNARAFKLISGQIVRYNPKTGTFAVGGIADGQYLLEGVWQLVSASRGRPTAEISQMGSVAITVGNGDVSNVMLKSEPLATLDGRLKIDGGRPGQSLQLQLQDAKDGQKKYGTTVSSDGEFRFTNLPCGTFRISELGIASAYVRSVTVGNLNLTSGKFVVPSNPQVQIEVSASLRSRTISGTVSGRKPGDSPSYVLAKNEITGTVQIANTDQSGRFSIRGLAPGKYDLYAWTSLEGIAYQIPYGLTQYERSKVTVTTEDNLSAGELAVPLAGEAMN